MTPSSQPGGTRRGHLWLLLALGGLLVVLFRNAWMCDDAYITFRVVDNFANGYGLRWNVAERVQGYTHPLWLALCAMADLVTGEIYYTVLALSLALSLLCAGLLATLAPDRQTALAGIGTLALSKPWVDYSTSGLESPLTHALLAAFLVAFIREAPVGASPLRRALPLALLGSALVLSRPDLILLVLPALAARAGWPPQPQRLLGLALGLLPVVAWTLFSLFYYGAPVPNTAYAKLGAGLSTGQLASQGLLYVTDLVRHSPLTAAVILVGALVGLTRQRSALLALGILLYLAYIVRIGGDFMSGRFFTAPFVVALGLLLHRGLPSPGSGRLVTVAAALLLGLAWPRAPVWSGAEYGRASSERPEAENGIADERAVYYQQTGLLPALRRDGPPLAHRWAEEGRWTRAVGPSVVRRMGNGFFGFYAGPGVHIVDGHALTDPLLARLPANTRRGWRIGHFRRVSPRGYEESLRTGRNQIADPDLAELWDHLLLVTRGPLLDSRRLRTVVELNLGHYDRLVRSWEERRDRERERRLRPVIGRTRPPLGTQANGNTPLENHHSRAARYGLSARNRTRRVSRRCPPVVFSAEARCAAVSDGTGSTHEP